MSEALTFRRIVAGGVLALAGGTALTGCAGDSNYEGTGNEYQVIGVIHDVEKDDTIHINQDQLKVVQSSGKATDWFKDHKGQDWFSDEFNFDPDYNQEESGFLGECEHNVTVGKVYDLQGDEIDPSELEAGDVVEIQGSIRTSNKMKGGRKSRHCGSDDKNVFETVRVIRETTER